MNEISEIETTLGGGILEGYTRLVVETDEKKPVTIVEITSDFMDVADGYRLRLRPDYDTQCSLSTGGQGSLP